MKSLKFRKRSIVGLTDYHHRKKLLTSFESILRIRLSKKNKYYCVGLYDTISLDQPDKCLNYLESRWIQDLDTTKMLNSNQKSAYVFGKFYAKVINDLQIPKNKKLILDIARKKNMQFESFVAGLYSDLTDENKFKFKTGVDVQLVLDRYKALDLSRYAYKN